MPSAKLHRGLFTSDRLDAYLAHEPEVKVDALGQGLWTATDGVTRSLFAEGGKSVVAFDTFGTPGRARAYRKAIERTVPKKPIGTVIYSHDHLDHTGYAADLAPEAEIVADALTAEVIGLRQADGQLAPTHTVRGPRNRVEFDGVGFELLNPGPTHGSGNLAAYFPDRKLLFMVDTVLPNARYGLLPDYHVCNFVKFMRGLLDLDFQTFVPGRFEVTDRQRFVTGCDYFEALQEACQKAFVEFVPVWVLSAMTEYVKPRLQDRFGGLDGYDAHVGVSALRIVHHYLMGGYGLEDTPAAGVLLSESQGRR
jgi:glyoxylase-like metal-dependent hydrolase (beta-lactamase superfamily II)